MPIKKKVLKKKTTKKPKKVAPSKKAAPKAMKPIGVVTHYYGGIGVAIVKFGKPIKKGVMVNFKGATTDFTQDITSMQYDHKDISSAPKGKQIGVKVKRKVRGGDEVYLVS